MSQLERKKGELVLMAVEVDHQCRVGAVAPPEPMLTGSEGSMGLPKAYVFPDMYPDQKLPEDLQQH